MVKYAEVSFAMIHARRVLLFIPNLDMRPLWMVLSMFWLSFMVRRSQVAINCVFGNKSVIQHRCSSSPSLSSLAEMFHGLMVHVCRKWRCHWGSTKSREREMFNGDAKVARSIVIPPLRGVNAHLGWACVWITVRNVFAFDIIGNTHRKIIFDPVLWARCDPFSNFGTWHTQTADRKGDPPTNWECCLYAQFPNFLTMPIGPIFVCFPWCSLGSRLRWRCPP